MERMRSTDGETDSFAEYRGLDFMESRIPIQDALVAFVPAEVPLDPRIEAVTSEHAECLWFPRPGGVEVMVPYAGGPFDEDVFTVRVGGWDHETCTRCLTRIPPMTLCWVTPSGRYVLLCAICYETFSRGISKP